MTSNDRPGKIMKRNWNENGFEQWVRNVKKIKRQLRIAI